MRGRAGRRRGWLAARVLAAVLALAAAGPATAAATDATRAELASLAERAKTDPAALEQLRQVDRVDGRAYAVEDALAGTRGEDLDRRLDEIAALGPRGGDPPEASDPRGEAGDILSSNRYEGSDLPRPFKGALEWIGEKLEPIGDWIGDRFRDLASITPGGGVTLWSIGAALLLVLLATLGSRTLRAHAQAGAEVRAAGTGPTRETAGELERAADRAERDGDLEAAVRLRFRAGLLRLDAREAIRFRPSISTREVSRALGSPEFDQLAALFDGVVYGGHEPSRDDVERSRRGWDAVLKETAR
ncbi:MAG TPA: DUF4129 domain-containing protein [Thermoleophilaceae bacterium]